MKKLTALCLTLAMLLCVLAIPAGAEEGGKVYRTYLGSDCPILNAQNSVETSLDTPTSYCGAFLYRTVPDEDGNGFHYTGDIAADLPVQIDEVTWQIPIDPAACGANGDPINADTMIYSYKMLLDPILVNRMADFLADYNITIVNAKEYNQQGESGTVAWEDVGIKKIDEYTIQITTDKEYTQTQVCSQFTNRATAPVYEPLYEAGMSEDRTSTTYGTTLDAYMSCGPYVFTTWDFDNKQIYVRNDKYWHSDLFHYDTVDVSIVKEMNARVQLWEKGELDDLSPDANTIETYIDDPRMVEYPSLTVFHIDINANNPENPLSASVNYRRAMYYALNRNVIAEDIFGYQEPAAWYVNGQAGILSESGLTYRESEYGKAVVEKVNSVSDNGYSPELAREYLAKAYEDVGLDADTVVTLRIAFGDDETAWKATAEYLMEEFPVIFEGKIKLEADTYAGISATDYKKSTDVWDFSPNDWTRGASRTYPYTCFYYYLESYGSHPNNYFDPEFEAQYAVCESVQDDYEQMLKETQKLEEIYIDKVVHIPVAQEVSYQMFSDRLVLPVRTYIPGFGWGTIYGDIAE